MTDRQTKTEATKKEYKRVYDNYNLPPRDILAKCSDGIWKRYAWQDVNRFGWYRWIKVA